MGAKIGIIGGSGFYQMEGLTQLEELEVDTPFGKPSDSILVGVLNGKEVAFLPRHGKGHRLLPSELNVRANIYALKSLGVEWLISVSAVGSLKPEIEPRDFVIPDQLYDHTKGRIGSFFGDGLVCHISLADPFCPVLRALLYKSGLEAGAKVHSGGTYICMEGPQFSTKAESNVYRRLGFDVIGMTGSPEAKLAREAEICYAMFACSTDYDCWHPDHENVSAQMILNNLLANVDLAKKAIKSVISKLPDKRKSCSCPNALSNALVTSWDLVPDETLKKVKLLVEKYLPKIAISS